MSLGIDSVYTAPSGALIALGLVTTSLGPTQTSPPNHPACAILRPLPAVSTLIDFYKADVANGGPHTQPNASNPNAGSISTAATSGTTANLPDGQYESMVGNGDPQYYFYTTPNSGGPGEGWYIYSTSSAGAAALGVAPGTMASDASDYAWALGMMSSWTSGRVTYAHNDPLSFLQTQSSATLSQVAPLVAPSSNQLFLYAAVAAGLAFLYYELS